MGGIFAQGNRCRYALGALVLLLASAIGALCLWLLPPKLGVPLLMSLSTANQLLSIGQLKADMRPLRDWWPDGPAPYLLGGLIGVPIGLSVDRAVRVSLVSVSG